MKKNNTPLVDSHLESFVGMQEHATDEYFYTRLRARMENRTEEELLIDGLKPIWVVSSMAVLFIINVYMLNLKTTTQQITTTEINNIKSFAEAYDQTLSQF